MQEATAWKTELAAWTMTTDVNLARGVDLGARLCDLRATGLPSKNGKQRGPLADADAAPLIRRLDALEHRAARPHRARGGGVPSAPLVDRGVLEGGAQTRGKPKPVRGA